MDQSRQLSVEAVLLRIVDLPSHSLFRATILIP